jgi:hypothetical protein
MATTPIARTRLRSSVCTRGEAHQGDDKDWLCSTAFESTDVIPFLVIASGSP